MRKTSVRDLRPLGQRDGGVLCLVASRRTSRPIEHTGVFRAVYYVLGGACPDGHHPDDLHIAELLKRLASEEVREVVLATNPNIEGETTAAYLARLIAARHHGDAPGERCRSWR